MSSTNIRGTETDNYKVLSSYETLTANDLEISISNALVKAQDITAGTYVSDTNASSWECGELSSVYVESSAIANYPAGTVTEFSAISTEIISSDASMNTYSANISAGSNNTYAFSSLNTSTPYYSSNYVITQSLVADCVASESGFVNAHMDVGATNANIQCAMQSRWNTKASFANNLSDVGEDPAAITRDTVFNGVDAFAKNGTVLTDASYVSSWASVNSDGSVAFTPIAAENQPFYNDLIVSDRDMTAVTLNVEDDVGIFRIQQAHKPSQTSVQDGISAPIIITDSNHSELTKAPLFDANGVATLAPATAKNSMMIPALMTDDNFHTLVGDAVYGVAHDDWKFSIDISSNNGGYFIDESHPLVSDLDVSDLHDNPYYMVNYVNNAHSMTISDSVITISSDVSGNTEVRDSIAIDLSLGEKLPSSKAGADGQIRFDLNTTTTRYTDLINTNVSAVTPVIHYTGVNVIPSEYMTNQNVQVMWQKVIEDTSTAPAEDYLVTNSGAILNLCSSDMLLNNLYNSADFSFNFDSTTLSDASVNIWKINSVNNKILLNDKSLYSDASYASNMDQITTVAVINSLTNDLSFNAYRVKLDAKTKEEITGLTNAMDATGWYVSYLDPSDTFVTSDTENAYTNYAHLPAYNNDMDTINRIEASSDLNFSYTYKTNTFSFYEGFMEDSVDVTYSSVSGDVSGNFTIPEKDITITYSPNPDISYVIIPDASYSFNTTVYNQTEYKLVYKTSNKVYSASFIPHYGPFNNIRLNVPDIHEITHQYDIVKLSNGSFMGSAQLAFVASTTFITIYNSSNPIYYIYQEITPAPDNSLTITGIFAKNDLKPVVSIVQGKDTDDVWTNVGTGPVDFDLYYHLTNTLNISIIEPSNNTMTVSCSFSLKSDQAPTFNYILDSYNYYIPFSHEFDADQYSLSYFNADLTNLTDKMPIGSSAFNDNHDFLTVQNTYSNTYSPSSNWVTPTNYTLTVIQDASSGNSNLFTVKDLANNVVFSLRVAFNTIFLGDYTVSYIPKDYYRVDTVIGVSTQFNEQFMMIPSSSTELDILAGVVIPATSSTITLGGYQSFRLKGDSMAINMAGENGSYVYGELGDASYNSGSLIFKYTEGADYSAEFTFPKYRGYKDDVSVLQSYIINRPATVVTFDVVGPLTQTLTSNMYVSEAFTVNSLIDASLVQVADLNVQGSFIYSIAPTGSSLNYAVRVTGDDVSYTIVNPQGSDIYDASGSVTLKDDIYAFDGSWYLTGRTMNIRPSRVKLMNSSYTDTSFHYEILTMPITIKIYKAINDNWLGDPSAYDTQDPDIAVDLSKWTYITEYGVSFSHPIGLKVVTGGSTSITQSTKMCYIISVPPYYKFEQISTSGNPTIPYDYAGGDHAANKTNIYMPYLTTSGLPETVFNPFAASYSYTGINGYSATITNSSAILNDITFTLLSATGINDYLDTTRYGIIVPGTNLAVSLYTGPYDSTSTNHTNPIWDGPVTSIPSGADVSNNSLIFRGRDASGKISFSAVQRPEDIGYPAGTNSYQIITNTSDQSLWYNIDFEIENSSWYNGNSPVTYFDFAAMGIKPTLYTVANVNDPSTQINKRRVYKYISNTTFNTDITVETFNMPFNSRSYCDFDISVNNTFPSTGIWNYSTLLNNTVVPDATISWTDDVSYSNIAYVAWAFGNSTTSKNMITELFGVQEGQKKWAFIHLDPFVKYLNQFGLEVSSVAWDGSIVAPLVSSRVLKLAPAITTPILSNNTHNIQQYSESTL